MSVATVDISDILPVLVNYYISASLLFPQYPSQF